MKSKGFIFTPLSTFLLICVALTTPPTLAEFNFEIGNRVTEKLASYTTAPIRLLSLLSTYRSKKAFSHDLRAPDRDEFLVLGDALLTTYPHDLVYYGLEDGTFVGHQMDSRMSVYREPGEGGYEVVVENGGGGAGSEELASAVSPEMQKHLESCVDNHGKMIPCLMHPGQSYIECIDGCKAIQKCPDENSQRDCRQLFDDNEDERNSCEEEVKWCISYREQIILPENDGAIAVNNAKIVNTSENNYHSQRGYIPWTQHCIDSSGLPTQTPGQNSVPGPDNLHNCYHSDGSNPVQRNLSGPYAYCGIDSDDDGTATPIICNTTFIGGFVSYNYDPRYRPWYTKTKEMQEPNWSEPYVFFQNDQMGISYSHPIYKTDEDDGRKVFVGVLALDLTLTGIASFLIKNYDEAENIVAIIEEAEPNYLIASSTGTTGVKKVLKDDHSMPCPEMENFALASEICTTVRIPVAELKNGFMERVISNSYMIQKKNGFPPSRLLPVQSKDDTDDVEVAQGVHASQTKQFSSVGGINWRIMIMSPVDIHEDDSILPGDDMFPFLVTPAIIGSVVCMALLLLFTKHRGEQEVIASDWRFTGAFIFGCALLNLACLSLIGPNTDSLCLSRMWFLNFFFVLALTPLFVKTWRFYKLLGDGTVIPRRQSISHAKTTLMMIPFILFEVLILTIFTFVDPSRAEEMLEYDDVGVTHRIVCTHENSAFFAVQVVYQGSLILVGCVLAFKTRNMKKEYRDNQQLMLTLYNIALVGTVILIVANVVKVYQGTIRIFLSVGVFWMTVFSCCVFVLPRLLQIHTRSSISSNRGRRSPPGRAQLPSAPSTVAVDNGFCASTLQQQQDHVEGANIVSSRTLGTAVENPANFDLSDGDSSSGRRVSFEPILNEETIQAIEKAANR